MTYDDVSDRGNGRMSFSLFPVWAGRWRFKPLCSCAVGSCTAGHVDAVEAGAGVRQLYFYSYFSDIEYLVQLIRSSTFLLALTVNVNILKPTSAGVLSQHSFEHRVDPCLVIIDQYHWQYVDQCRHICNLDSLVGNGAVHVHCGQIRKD